MKWKWIESYQIEYMCMYMCVYVCIYVWCSIEKIHIRGIDSSQYIFIILNRNKKQTFKNDSKKMNEWMNEGRKEGKKEWMDKIKWIHRT